MVSWQDDKRAEEAGRELLLRLLKEARSEFVSSAEVCHRLGVSRTAVWKQINALRRDGYLIEAHPNAGYRLIAVPDRLYPEEIRYRLGTDFIGRVIRYFPVVDSTNRVAREWAEADAPDGALVVAEEQTGGRGRLGRSWFSPACSGLWFSVIFRPPVLPGEVTSVALLVSVAVAEAVAATTGLKVGIKWPNDLLLNGRKLAGILAEMRAEVDGVRYLVIGIGMNVNVAPELFPPEIKETATSLLVELGQAVDRVRLMQNILRDLELVYCRWLAGGAKPLLQRWRELSVTLGQEVRLTTINNSWEGVAEDIDDGGALILRLADGRRMHFNAGEVTLRGKGGELLAHG